MRRIASRSYGQSAAWSAQQPEPAARAATGTIEEEIIKTPVRQRKKAFSSSLLDQINGIGSIRKRALLNHFGSARAVESASLDEIKSVEGVEEKVAKKIYNFFHE